MGLKRRGFTREFKLNVIREVDAGKSSAQVARKYLLAPLADLQVAQALSPPHGQGLCRHGARLRR